MGREFAEMELHALNPAIGMASDPFSLSSRRRREERAGERRTWFS
jgi:hypothetical protein